MKRGGYIERKTELRRSRMKRKPARRLTRPGPGSDLSYLEAVRKLPCLAPLDISMPAASMCEGPVVAHHAGPKSNDSTGVPLCWKHHQNWHDLNGVFKGWMKSDRRLWADMAIAHTRLSVRSQP